MFNSLLLELEKKILSLQTPTVKTNKNILGCLALGTTVCRKPSDYPKRVSWPCSAWVSKSLCIAGNKGSEATGLFQLSIFIFSFPPWVAGITSDGRKKKKRIIVCAHLVFKRKESACGTVWSWTCSQLKRIRIFQLNTLLNWAKREEFHDLRSPAVRLKLSTVCH